MRNRSQIRNPKSKLVIAGAGPAGSSLAIRLAGRGYDVTLIERETFPRQKLCGEFISPECFRHFEELGVSGTLFSGGGEHVFKTTFFSKSGRNVCVPTSWFGSGDFALSLSRAEMDWNLLDRARNCGVVVLDKTRVVGIEVVRSRIAGLEVNKVGESRFKVSGDIFIDATGRSAILSKLASKVLGKPDAKPRRAALLGFKNHFAGVDIPRGVCEIYFFNGGYGGLSNIEAENANFCFLIKASGARDLIGNTNKLFDLILSQNVRAGHTLRNAVPVRDWIGVSVDGFGSKPAPPLANLFSVGDAAAFIDPFTGSGMLMAMQSAELLAGIIAASDGDLELIDRRYRASHASLFEKRLRISAVLRRAAFLPAAASTAIFAAGLSSRFREILAKGTRSGKSASAEGS